ncbi:MAG: GspH/FimT family pseudopilin [bacterium]
MSKIISSIGSRNLQVYSSRLKPRSSLGFTLVEMLIVMAIAGVLVGLALPGFNFLLTGAKLDSGVDKITEAISYSRSLSLNNRGTERIVICPSSDHNNPAVVNPSCSATTEQDYSEGWLVFIDCNGDELFDAATNLCDDIDTPGSAADTPEQIISVQTQFKDITLESSDANRIVFDRSGRTLSTTDFTIKKDGNDYATVNVSALGSMSITHHDYY